MISIIIPAYNEEKNIGGALSRLKKLTLPHETIVADDASTDRTADIARASADIVLSAAMKHPTIAANRNTGARAAKGDLLAFMDGDSVVEDPDAFFSRAKAHFDADADLVALTGSVWVSPGIATLTDKLVYTAFNWVHRIKNNVLHMGESSGKFQMLRAEAFEKVGGYREDLVAREDADIFQRLSKIGRTHCDPGLVVCHSGRRAHAIGWPRLLATWMIESFWVAVFGKALSTNWDRYWEPGARKRA